MTMLRHIDFEVPGWGETPGGPRAHPDYAAAVLARQPVAYWRFDESAGPTAIDQAGGHDAAYVDTAAIDFAQPGALAYEADRAIRITGSADLAVVADSAAFRVEQFTAIAWVRPDWLSDHQFLALATTKGAFFDTAGFLIRTDVPAETIFLRVGVGTGGLVSPALPLAVDRWQMVAFSYAWDGAQSVLRASRDGAPWLASSAGGRIGYDGVGELWIAPGSLNFRGSLDELALFDSVLSDDDLAALYRIGAGR